MLHPVVITTITHLVYYSRSFAVVSRRLRHLPYVTIPMIQHRTIPLLNDLNTLTRDEQHALMIIRDGHNDTAAIERELRNVFVWAILTKSSDVHVDGHRSHGRLFVKIGVRTPQGIVNQVYTDPHSQHFETKLFQLTATPQGGSTADILSTRFSMELPARYAITHGLIPRNDEPYEVDVRVQYIRTFDGFTFICRLLDQQRAPALHELGLSYATMRVILQAISEPSGLILVTGPTGSGKTTLLNAILNQLNNGTGTIFTIENPVEFRLHGPGPIKQVQVQGDITFASALRAGLRADPDYILIGEIRDEETMEIALQAAQTGHLVLATLHANGGPDTFSRALDLTVNKRRDAYRIADTLKLVLAQRLLDRYDGEPTVRSVTHDEKTWLRVNGLGTTHSLSETTGTQRTGKAAIVEAIAMTDDIKQLMRAEHLDTPRIYQRAAEQLQYETLAMAGVRAVLTNGCRLRDCRTRLESTTEAERHPGLRAQLAIQYHLTLAEVGALMDDYCRALDAGEHRPLKDYVPQYLSTGVAA